MYWEWQRLGIWEIRREGYRGGSSRALEKTRLAGLET